MKTLPACLGNATEERIGSILLFIFTDPRNISHYRAIGPNNWTAHGSSQDKEQLSAEARRMCIRKNMQIQEENYGKDVEK